METNLIYLNTAAFGQVAPSSVSAANELYSSFAHNGSTRTEEWRATEESRIRQTIAGFLGAPAANIAMVPNFSWAMNGIVQSLKGTERVLLYARDYPSFLEPFRINNFNITWVDTLDGFNIEVDKIVDAIRERRVDIVALSHVQWSSGYRLDLLQIGQLCKEYGVLFIVDGTQSIGANVLDLSSFHVDVFAASNYKWMNAGFGTGILYVSDSFLDRYPPVVGGHNSYRTVGDQWKYVPSAQSYEPGHPNMFGLTVLDAAIKHKVELGMEHIARHDRRLTELFLKGIEGTSVRILGDYTMNHRSPIVYLFDENGLGDWIHSNNIVVTRRNGWLRVSTHFYNTEADVQALVDCIKSAPVKA